MKVVGVVCSPRVGGNTEILVGEVLAGARSEGAETELITLADKRIEFCDACGRCEGDGHCHIQDDMQPIYRKLEEADGVVVGSPVWFWSVTGQAKTFLDRLYAMQYPKKRLMNKVGAAVVVAGRQGKTRALDVILEALRSHRMILADTIDGLGYEPGEIRRDERAMRSAWELGREMVQLINKRFTWPDEFGESLYRLVMRKYKVSRLPRQQ